MKRSAKSIDTIMERLKANRDVGRLIRLLRYQKLSSVRREAAMALGTIIGDKRAVDPLIVALETDDTKAVRTAAADALGHLGDAKAMTPLKHAIRDEVGSVRSTAQRSLASLARAEPRNRQTGAKSRGKPNDKKPLRMICFFRRLFGWLPGMKRYSIHSLGDGLIKVWVFAEPFDDTAKGMWDKTYIIPPRTLIQNADAAFGLDGMLVAALGDRFGFDMLPRMTDSKRTALIQKQAGSAEWGRFSGSTPLVLYSVVIFTP